MVSAVVMFMLLVAAALATPLIIEFSLEDDWVKRMREPRFPCARCEHVVDGDRCAACFDRITGEPLPCWTSRATKQCARNAKEDEQ